MLCVFKVGQPHLQHASIDAFDSAITQPNEKHAIHASAAVLRTGGLQSSCPLHDLRPLAPLVRAGEQIEKLLRAETFFHRQRGLSRAGDVQGCPICGLAGFGQHLRRSRKVRVHPDNVFQPLRRHAGLTNLHILSGKPKLQLHFLGHSRGSRHGALLHTGAISAICRPTDAHRDDENGEQANRRRRYRRTHGAFFPGSLCHSCLSGCSGRADFGRGDCGRDGHSGGIIACRPLHV